MASSLLVQPSFSPQMRLSPLASAVPITPSEMSAWAARTLSHASTPTTVQPPPYTFMQPLGYAAPATTSPMPTSIPAPSTFPLEEVSKTYTTASYSKEPIPELVNSDKAHWAFSLEVPIPAQMVYPTLASLEYTVKYGTQHGHGTSAIQTNILLTKIPAAPSDACFTPAPNGIITDPPRERNYRAMVGVPAQTIDGVPVACLSSVPAVKENGHTSEWHHHIDKQQILPHVRIIGDSRLYLQLDVAETPSALMLRSLSVDVSATWVEDMQPKTTHDAVRAAERRIQAAQQKKDQEEHARVQAERKSAAARQAIEIAVQKEAEAKRKSEADTLAKKLEEDHAKADRDVARLANDLAEKDRRAKEAADASAKSQLAAEHDVERKAEAEHQAELAAKERAKKEREARSAIERQL